MAIFCDMCAVPGHTFPKCDTPMPPAIKPTNKNYAVVSVVFGIQSIKHSIAAVDSVGQITDKKDIKGEIKHAPSGSSSTSSLGRLDDAEESRMGIVIYDGNFDLSDEDCQVSSTALSNSEGIAFLFALEILS